MGFTIPNYTDAVANKAVGDQAEPDSVDFQILGNRQNGLVYDETNFPNNGLIAAEGTISNSVTIQPYKVYINGSYVSKSSSTTLSLGEGSSSPRFDLVVISVASPTSPTVITGTPNSANPEFPSIATGDIVLAAVYRAGTGTTGYVANTNIVDKRTFVNSNQVWYKNASPLVNTADAATAKIGDLWVDTSATGTGQSMLWVKNSSSSWENLAEYIAPASTNTANTLVLRDGSGNFSAGTITATLNGNASSVTNGVYNNGGTYSINITGSSGYATSAGSATTASSASDVTGISGHIVAQSGFEIFTGAYGGETLTIKRGASQPNSSASTAWRASNGTSILAYVRWDGAYIGPSDRALKNNIKVADSEKLCDVIDNIVVKTFEYKHSPGLKQIGIIAQDIIDYIPEIVDGEDGSYGVNEVKFVYPLIAKVQQLEQRLQALENGN